jgi:antitoxin (DNA-binding transcriptional repressor) of toxin-antitoxin stability system
VIAAVRSGERLALTVNRTPVADIVPHGGTRSPWIPSAALERIVEEASMPIFSTTLLTSAAR